MNYKVNVLTLHAPITTAKQTIHMKYQDLFSMKNNLKQLECYLQQILLDALRNKNFKHFIPYSFFVVFYIHFFHKRQTKVSNSIV